VTTVEGVSGLVWTTLEASSPRVVDMDLRTVGKLLDRLIEGE